jgi:hypothetical protein
LTDIIFKKYSRLKLGDSLRNNGMKEHTEEGVERDQDKLGTGIWEKDEI